MSRKNGISRKKVVHESKLPKSNPSTKHKTKTFIDISNIKCDTLNQFIFLEWSFLQSLVGALIKVSPKHQSCLADACIGLKYRLHPEKIIEFQFMLVT